MKRWDRPKEKQSSKNECAGASCALVLEAGRKGDAIITARKGTGSVRAVATGVAGHAGNAHREGKNAIWALARFIDRAQALTDYQRGVTVNVGKVSGGHSKNTVPDHAEALVDYRFETIADGAATRAALGDAAERAAESVPGTSLVLEDGAGRLPLERSDENLALYREYAACAKAAGRGAGEAPRLGGGSDASPTSAMGNPSIDGLGPRGTGFPYEGGAHRGGHARPQGRSSGALSPGACPLAAKTAKTKDRTLNPICRLPDFSASGDSSLSVS